MKSAVVALLTIAAILLAFVLSMGIFFALIRPRSSTTTYVYELMDGISGITEDPDFLNIPEKAAVHSEDQTEEADIVQDAPQPQLQPNPKPKAMPPSAMPPSPPNVPRNSKARSPTAAPVKPKATTTEQTALPTMVEDPTTVDDATTEATLVFTAATEPEEQEQGSTVVFGGGPTQKPSALERIRPVSALESKVIRHGGSQSKERKLILPPSPVVVNLQEEVITLAPADGEGVETGEGPSAGLEQVYEKVMAKYGKVVGLAYRDGKLYVAAHRQGNITVLSTPDLKFVEEFTCKDCRIYDLDTTQDGSLVIAQGMGQKLTKMDMVTKKISKEISLTYETKGIAVSPEDMIFVMTRSHDKIYQYDSNLKEIGVIPFVNKAQDDCNFLNVAHDAYELYLSCQGAILIVDYSGNQLQRLIPPGGPQGSYSVGIAQDDEGNILAVRRGRSQIDVFRVDGTFVARLGRRADTLWSDLVVVDGYAYVVEYLSATVKALKLTYS